jgi:hypothetical protein
VALDLPPVEEYTGMEKPMDPPCHWLSGQPLANGMLTEVVNDTLKSNRNSIHEGARSLFRQLHAKGYQDLRIEPYTKRQLGVPIIDFTSERFQQALRQTAEQIGQMIGARMFQQQAAQQQAAQQRAAQQDMGQGGSARMASILGGIAGQLMR